MIKSLNLRSAHTSTFIVSPHLSINLAIKFQPSSGICSGLAVTEKRGAFMSFERVFELYVTPLLIHINIPRSHPFFIRLEISLGFFFMRQVCNGKSFNSTLPQCLQPHFDILQSKSTSCRSLTPPGCKSIFRLLTLLISR